MSCSKFQILNLPYLAIQHVTQYMDPIDILDLSFCSKRAKMCAMSHRATRKYCNVITRTTYDKKVGLEIVFSEDATLSWFLLKELNPKKLGNFEPIQQRRVGDITFKTSAKEMLSNTLFTTCDNLESSFKFVAEYILSLFPCPVQSLELDIKLFSDLTPLSNWKPINKCKALKIRAGGDSSREDVKKVMNMVGGYESLEIVGYDKEEFFNEKMASIKMLKLMDAFFLSEETFFKLNCETIELGENSYNYAVLNNIIKKWMAKKLENVKTAAIFMEHIPLSQLQTIFAGIQINKWDSKSRHRYYKKSPSFLFDCQNGFDILRSDGKLATVVFADSSFNFLVWNERFPDLTILPTMYYSRNPKQPIVYRKKYDTSTVDLNLVVDVNNMD